MVDRLRPSLLWLPFVWLLASCDPKPGAELLLENGRILSVDARFQIFSSMVVNDGRVVALGDDGLGDSYEPVRRVDLDGAVVMPGFIDVDLSLDRPKGTSLAPLIGSLLADGITRLVRREDPDELAVWEELYREPFLALPRASLVLPLDQEREQLERRLAEAGIGLAAAWTRHREEGAALLTRVTKESGAPLVSLATNEIGDPAAVFVATETSQDQPVVDLCVLQGEQELLLENLPAPAQGPWVDALTQLRSLAVTEPPTQSLPLSLATAPAVGEIPSSATKDSAAAARQSASVPMRAIDGPPTEVLCLLWQGSSDAGDFALVRSPADGATPFRSLLSSGVKVILSRGGRYQTPLAAVGWAVSQQVRPEPEGGEHGLGEALTAAEALTAVTLRAARIAGRQQEEGSLEPGKLANFVVLDADPLTTVAAQMAAIRVRQTWIAGRIVFERAD